MKGKNKYSFRRNHKGKVNGAGLPLLKRRVARGRAKPTRARLKGHVRANFGQCSRGQCQDTGFEGRKRIRVNTQSSICATNITFEAAPSCSCHTRWHQHDDSSVQAHAHVHIKDLAFWQKERLGRPVCTSAPVIRGRHESTDQCTTNL